MIQLYNFKTRFFINVKGASAYSQAETSQSQLISKLNKSSVICSFVNSAFSENHSQLHGSHEYICCCSDDVKVASYSICVDEVYLLVYIIFVGFHSIKEL